jgi:hypothetical protein
MNQYIVYQNPNSNNIECLIPCLDVTISSEYLNEVLKDIPKDSNGNMVEYKFIDKMPNLIETYDFINSEQSPSGGQITRNRVKLHELKKKEWRYIRKSKLEMLDIEFMKSIETNDVEKQEEIKLKKQQLRDVTNTDVTNISDDDLEIYIPDVLKN